jgi:hypothetical protein
MWTTGSNLRSQWFRLLVHARVISTVNQICKAANPLSLPSAVVSTILLRQRCE